MDEQVIPKALSNYDKLWNGGRNREEELLANCYFNSMKLAMDNGIRSIAFPSKWSKAFWARGYYVATVGNITEDAIKKYISEQSEESRKEDSDGAA